MNAAHPIHEQPVRGPAGLRRTEDICERLQTTDYRVDDRQLTLPMKIPDCGIMAQVFAVRTRAAMTVLNGPGLVPTELWPGTTALTLMGVRYRDSPLGNYDEAAISLPVYAPDMRPRPLLGALDTLLGRASHFVYAMPVDQEFTCHAGRFLWGYPKFLADIEIENDDYSATTRLSHEGELVFGLRAATRPGRQVDVRLTNLTCYRGELRRIELHFKGSGLCVRPGGSRPEVGERHPLARTLRDLGLPKRPLISLSIESASATMGLPETPKRQSEA